MYCENPNIILRKDLSKYFKNYLSPKLIYNDGNVTYSFDYKKNGFPSPKENNITLENYKNWRFLLVDGTLIDVYQPVPCGKCLLCRDKKAKEWSTRSSCETAAAEYPPLFVTLTYEDKYLPHDGVKKDHLQKFLKRFRINWYRKFHYALNLRYFAVGEYGRKYGRPHYHLLLWNIPNDGQSDSPLSLVHLKTVEELIQRSWSQEVSYRGYFALKTYQRFKENRVRYGKKRIIYYRKFGRIEVTPDRGNSAGYAMKYMRKEAINPLGYKNDPFYLSSRRNGGIGIPFLKMQLESIRKAPASTTIQVPTSLGSVKTYSLPRCFKDKLFPTFSRLVSSHQAYQVERAIQLSDVLYEYYPKVKDIVSCGIMILRKKLGSFFDNLRKDMRIYKKEKLFPINMNRLHNFEYLEELYDNFVYIITQLSVYDPLPSHLEEMYRLKESRIDLLNLMKFPEVDVQAAVYSVKRKIALKSLGEVF